MDQSLTSRTALIMAEFEKLTNQPCYFLPGKDPGSINSGLEESLCPEFCYEIAKSDVGNYLCSRKRKALIINSIKRLEPSFSVCHVGLYEMMVPVFIGEEVLGVFNACFSPQKLVENITAQIDHYENKYNCEAAVLLESLNKITSASESTLRSTSNLLNALVSLYIHPDENAVENSWQSQNKFDALSDSSEITNAPIIIKALSDSIEQTKDDKNAYQASDDILKACFNNIYIDIRIGRLVKAKEFFKALMAGAYLEQDLDKEKYAAFFLIHKFNDCFLRKTSFYKEVYDSTMPIIKKIGSAKNLLDIRDYINDYFDAMVQIYLINEKSRHVLINKIVNFVDENYGNSFTIKDMVKSMNVSFSYATRTFTEQTGVSIKWYINEIRMYNAQHFLRYTDWTVNVVAARVGYTDVRSFYKMFEKHFGIPCSKLRNLYGNQRNIQKEIKK